MKARQDIVSLVAGICAEATLTVFLWRLTVLPVEEVVFWALLAYAGGAAYGYRWHDMPERRKRRVVRSLLQMLICGAVAGLILVPLGIPATELFIVAVLFGILLGILNEVTAALRRARKDTRREHTPDSYRCQEYVYQDVEALRNVKMKAIRMKGSPLTRSMGIHYQRCLEELGLWIMKEDA